MVLKAIRMIIARKCVERIQPLVATGMEVHATIGLARDEQLSVARQYEVAGKVVIGETLNDICYRLVEVDV